MRLQIKTILTSVFAGLAVLISIQGLAAVRNIEAIHSAIDGVYHDQMPSVSAARNLQSAWDRIRIAESNITSARTRDELDDASKELVAGRKLWRDNYGLYKDMIDPVHTEELKSFEVIGVNFDKLASFDDAALADAGKGAFSGVSTKAGDMAQTYADNGALIESLVKANEGELKDVKGDIDKIYGGTFWLTIFVAGVSILVAACAGAFAALGIGKPLNRLSGLVERLATGDTSSEIPYLKRRDELGTFAMAMDSLRASLDSRAEMSQRAETAQLEKEKRHRELLGILTAFQTDIVSAVEHLDSDAAQMRCTAEALGNVAERTRSGAEAAAGDSTRAANRITAVSAAADEFGASNREMTAQAQRTSATVRQAADVAERANLQVVGLTRAAAEIGHIVEVITSIAAQTNLLALNATIEAARVGEAGRGFAVVAAEVKALANQTARATQEIAGQVEAIQSASAVAATSITDIASVMDGVTQLAGAIEGSVSQQELASNEIAQNISAAAGDSQRLSANVDGVRGTVEETYAEADRVKMMSEKLASVTGHLRETVGKYIHEIELVA